MNQVDVKLLVGENIRNIRRYQKLTQSDLASVLKLSKTSIANIEGGKQNVWLSDLHNIAFALQVPIVMLFEKSESEQNIVDDMIFKYKMLESQLENLQKEHEKCKKTFGKKIKE